MTIEKQKKKVVADGGTVIKPPLDYIERKPARVVNPLPSPYQQDLVDIIFLSKLILIICIITFGVTLCTAAKAGEWGMLVGSLHEESEDVCEFNPGVHYTTDGFTSMVYRNSQCKLGAAFSLSEPVFSNDWRVHYGIALGYDYMPVLPYIALNVRVGQGYVGWIPAGFLRDAGGEHILFYGINF